MVRANDTTSLPGTRHGAGNPARQQESCRLGGALGSVSGGWSLDARAEPTAIFGGLEA
jgi:hypothetical protein